MKIVLDLSDDMIYKCIDLQKDLNIKSFEDFVIYSLNLGVKTIDQQVKIQNMIDERKNVISFKPSRRRIISE